MKYGAMNNPVNSILDEIELISSMGFDYLELTMDAPGAHYSIIKNKKKEIQKALKYHKTGLVCHLPTFVYHADLTQSIRRASLEETLMSLETATEINAEKTVLHPGIISGMGRYAVDLAQKYAFESLETIVSKAEKLGLKLCLENMPPRFMTFFEPGEFEKIFKIFPGLHMTLDIGHANIDCNKEHRALNFIQKFKDRLSHIHISDNNGKKDEHLPIGQGNINFREIADAIKKQGYNDTITLEIFTENRQHDLIKSREKFESMLI